MSTHYEFAAKAERILMVEVSYQGAIRPMHITDPSNQTDDLNLDPIELKTGEPVEFSIAAKTDLKADSCGLLAIEFWGWRVGQNYRPVVLQTVLNKSWVFGPQAQPEYEPPAVAPGAKPNTVMHYRFERTADMKAELSWWNEVDGSVERGSVELSAENEFANIGLRLVGDNEGQLSFDELKFGESSASKFTSPAPNVD